MNNQSTIDQLTSMRFSAMAEYTAARVHQNRPN